MANPPKAGHRPLRFRSDGFQQLLIDSDPEDNLSNLLTGVIEDQKKHFRNCTPRDRTISQARPRAPPRCHQLSLQAFVRDSPRKPHIDAARLLSLPPFSEAPPSCPQRWALPVQRCWLRLRALTFSWPAAGYHAKPRILGLDTIYKPDPHHPDTKPWHKGPAYEAKLYGRHGSASGVKPESLWPSPEQLRALEEEEKEWCPSLGEMLERVEAKEKELQRIQRERERLIAANMAKMPKMVEEWRRSKKEAKQKARDEKARKERLLVIARERFGVHVDFRSAKFQEMMKELEKEERKKMKAVKRKQKEEERAAMLNAIPTAAPPPPAPDTSV
ncbi:growth arrest and DNA damage-inducible proteins-interacting protein 1 [Hyla sarda]|uniref:growth arrest and DNA damage-inducible proteins-interacting protein 1 n=1 Tax=Hyla sarda TaxID=327740 RepID=UPI0024C39A54|nr:growth arrest and DNA damage-inducible proteins-interacting protein 1 [Hyla sarda]